MKIGGMGSRPTFFVSKRSPDGMWHKYGPRPPGKRCQGAGLGPLAIIRGTNHPDLCAASSGSRRSPNSCEGFSTTLATTPIPLASWQCLPGKPDPYRVGLG